MAGPHYLHRLGMPQYQPEELGDRIPAYVPPGRGGGAQQSAPAQQPFNFHKNRMDWRVLHGVNLHVLAQTTDVDALDRCLNAGLAHGDLEAEDPSTLTLTNVLRVARLCQLAIQYFIATQDSLVGEAAGLQAAKDHADAGRAKAEDRFHALARKYKSEQQRLRDIERIMHQLEATHLLEQQQREQQDEQPARPRRTSSEPVTVVPPPVHTDGMTREELRDALGSFYDMLASTVTSNQDDLRRLRAEQADQVSKFELERTAAKQREDDLAKQLAKGSPEAEARLSALHKKMAVMKKSMGLMEDEIRRLRSRPKPQPDMGLQSTIADHLGTISGLRNELDGSLRRRDEAEAHARNLENSLQSSIGDLESRNRRLKEELQKAMHERDALKVRCSNVNKEVAKVNAAFEQLRLDHDRLQDELRRAKQNWDELSKKAKSSQEEHTKEVSRLQRQLEEGHTKLLAAKRDIERASKDVYSAKSDMDHACQDIDSFIASRPIASY